MIPKRIDTFDKLKDFLSMFIKETPTTEGRFKIYYSLLTQIGGFEEELINRLDVFCVKRLIERQPKDYNEINYELLENADNYFDINNVSRTATEDRVLDLIGDFLGIKRNVYVNYVDTEKNIPDSVAAQVGIIQATTSSTSSGSGFTVLNNYCFLLYIQSTIYKNTFDGTRKRLAEIYGRDITSETDKRFQILLPTMLGVVYEFSRVDQDNLSCDVIMSSSNAKEFGKDKDTCQIIMLFLSGLLHIKSLGIEYTLETSSNYYPYQAFTATNDEEPTATPPDDGNTILRTIGDNGETPTDETWEDYDKIGILK